MDTARADNPNVRFPDAYRTVGIVGLGLLGASLGLCLRQRVGDAVRVLGWARREDTVREALRRGVVAEASTHAADILPRADLTVVCLPLDPTLAFVQEYAGLWRPGCTVTDVGSTKARLVQELRPRLAARGVHFVGSHPMAGSEQSGMGHAEASLYEGAAVFVTDRPEDAPEAVQALLGFWRATGARPHSIPADRHDALTARTSHALHLLANAAVHAFPTTDTEAVLGTAGAFRDLTRIAASSPDMWTQVARHNRTNLLAALAEFEAELPRLRRLVEEEDWAGLRAYLEAGREARTAWLERWLRERGRPL